MGFLDRTVFRGQSSNLKKGKDIQREREEWERQQREKASPKPEAKTGPRATPPPMPPLAPPELPLDITPDGQPDQPMPQPVPEPKAKAETGPRVRPKTEPREMSIIDKPLPLLDEPVPEPRAVPLGEQASGTDITPKSKLFNEAEALRKAGRVHEAELKYLDSIKEEEKEGPKAAWRQSGPSPTRYETLAKMYYNTNRDELALQIMDKYLAYCKDCGKNDLRMTKLRASMEDSSLKRQIIKGWAYSVDEPGEGQAL